MIYELVPRYSTRKSFYGKAQVTEKYKYKELYSYGTLVAYISYRKAGITIYKYLGHYSTTTTCHQKEFFKQEGLSDDDIKVLFQNGVIRKEVAFE